MLPEIEEDSIKEMYLSPLMPDFYLKFSENTELVVSKTQANNLINEEFFFFTSVENKRRNI